MSKRGLTIRFVEAMFGLGARVRDDPAVFARMDALVGDGIAVGLAGAGERGPTLLAEEAAAQTGGPVGDPSRAGATLLAREGRLPPVPAARVNGAAMHVLDYEPMWNPANHAVSTVLPALLAL